MIVIPYADIGNDFVTTEIMLTFPPGSTIQCGDLVIEDDNRVEDVEHFDLSLEVIPTPRVKRPPENRLPSNRTSTIPGTIEDDDVLKFTLTVTPMRSPEGTTVTALITATVEYEIDFFVLFNFTDETAVRRVDYNFDRTERRKMFTPTNNTHMISISYIDDDIVEGDHTYLVSMLVRDATRPFVLPPAVQATIEDTDELCISFMPAAYMVDEGDTVSLTFMLQQLLEVPVRVDISFTDGSAVSPDDYTSDTQTIRIPAGGTMGMVDVPTIADTIIENSETFVAMFARVRGDGTDGVLNKGCSSSADVTIIDTTTAEVFFSPTMYSVPEGDSVTLTLMIDADVAPGVNRTFTINTQDGTATSADDYVAGPYTATFSGTNIATITIDNSGNNVFENDETFTAVVEGGSTDSLIQPGTDDDEATINIEESGELTVQFTMIEYRVVENNGPGVVFLETSGPHDLAFTVTVTVIPDTATAFEDYDALSADVIFNPGETTKPFNINILDDKILERDETIILKLFVSEETLGEYVYPGAINMTTLVIEDDEVPTVGFMVGRSKHPEGARVNLTVNRTGFIANPLNFSVRINTRFRSAQEIDYDLETTVVVFSQVKSDYEEQNVTVLLINDGLKEVVQEYFILSLHLEPGLSVAYSNQYCFVIIEDVNYVRTCSVVDIREAPFKSLKCTYTDKE